MDFARILLIDNNRECRYSVSTFLSAEGYKVCCVDNGHEGLEKAADERFDLIILDLLLPDIKGEEVCSKLKNNRRYSVVPILVLSEEDETEDIEKLFQMGVDDYIVKPPRFSYLLNRVEFNISNKRPKK